MALEDQVAGLFRRSHSTLGLPDCPGRVASVPVDGCRDQQLQRSRLVGYRLAGRSTALAGSGPTGLRCRVADQSGQSARRPGNGDDLSLARASAERTIRSACPVGFAQVAVNLR